MRRDRRRFLGSVGVGAIAVLAGCSSGGTSPLESGTAGSSGESDDRADGGSGNAGEDPFPNIEREVRPIEGIEGAFRFEIGDYEPSRDRHERRGVRADLYAVTGYPSNGDECYRYGTTPQVVNVSGEELWVEELTTTVLGPGGDVLARVTHDSSENNLLQPFEPEMGTAGWNGEIPAATCLSPDRMVGYELVDVQLSELPTSS